MSVSSLNIVINPGLSINCQIGLPVRLILCLKMPPEFVSFTKQDAMLLWYIDQGSLLMGAGHLTLLRMYHISVLNVLLQL